MSGPLIPTLGIAGVGLIGGSFAAALRKAGAVGRVLGMGRGRANLDAALRLGVIDAVAGSPEELARADLILLAMPVGQMGAVMQALAPHLGPQQVVTDAGSTKQDVVALARAHLGPHLAGFVPGHPIAGAEKSGVAAARADLYRGKRVVLTPLPENTPAAVQSVRSIWELCGARVSELTPVEHDRVFAAVSHLPHLLAFALVHDLAQRNNADQLFGFAASGFRDFTRIASSHPEMWRDICVANRTALLQELDAYMHELLRTRVLLASADSAGLERMFDSARTRRDAWLEMLQQPDNRQ